MKYKQNAMKIQIKKQFILQCREVRDDYRVEEVYELGTVG